MQQVSKSGDATSRQTKAIGDSRKIGCRYRLQMFLPASPAIEVHTPDHTPPDLRQAELEVSLKLEMLQRGMSADEIVRVLQARSGHDGLPGRCATSGQEVPFGIEQR
jgi:hypothetical protein